MKECFESYFSQSYLKNVIFKLKINSSMHDSVNDQGKFLTLRPDTGRSSVSRTLSAVIVTASRRCIREGVSELPDKTPGPRSI